MFINIYQKTICTLSKACGFLYAFMMHLKRSNKRVTNKKILIFATGHIGNAIIDAPAVDDLIKYYQTSGYNVSILCSSALWNVFFRVITTSNVEFVDINYHYEGNGTDYHTVRATLDRLQGMEFEKIIVTLTNCDPLAHYVISSIPSNEAWGIFDDVSVNTYAPRHFFERYYTNKVKVHIDLQEALRLKLLLNRLGIVGHRTRITYIEQRIKYAAEKHPYATIAVDSMCDERKWPEEEYTKLIDLLLENSDLNICLTGTNVDENTYSLYESTYNSNSRVLNKIGKTSFEEWLELIRNARFHIGVDSGSIHIAASVGTTSYCLTGVWDGRRVFPYQIDDKTNRTIEPICIYRGDTDPYFLNCYACKVKHGKFGVGNIECSKLCRLKEPCLCLKKIGAMRVFETIKLNSDLT